MSTLKIGDAVRHKSGERLVIDEFRIVGVVDSIPVVEAVVSGRAETFRLDDLAPFVAQPPPVPAPLKAEASAAVKP